MSEAEQFFCLNLGMPFIESFSINPPATHPFPYNIPAVLHAKNISTDQDITIFVGDNGCGKSTLLACSLLVAI